ncbi:helix-hairpin-helix domain-containing protein [Puteibacter caeruleilacunae]|nr:helix-hairpin-helix domain-containing protein [Puteibacter caeruleilacunae]
MKSRQFFRKILSFSKGERVGMLVLVFFIVVLLVIKSTLPMFTNDVEIDQAAIEKEARDYFVKLEDSITTEILHKGSTNYHFHQFDPNECSQKELVDMGVPQKVASNLIKYREKGGRYSSKTDLYKIYGMNDMLYERLAEYVKIHPSFIQRKHRRALNQKEAKEIGNKQRHIKKSIEREVKDSLRHKYDIKKVEVVDLNHADTLDLIALKGIGPVYARRIIKYRQLLGGYCCKEQLLEVYGLRMETLKMIVPRISIDVGEIKKVNLNFADYHQLRSHPYVSNELAKLIVRQRSRKGKFVDFDEFSERLNIDKETLKKLKPYVQI